MKKETELYSIFDNMTMKTTYYHAWDTLSIHVSVPNGMIQDTIDIFTHHAGWCQIVTRIAPEVGGRFTYPSQAGALIYVTATAANIFAALNELGIHQHTGRNYRANGSCWARPARKANYTHRAYRRDDRGALVSRLIEGHNAKQFRANGWHVVAI